MDESRRLLVVADGMGGHSAGEVAARMVVETVTDFVANAEHVEASTPGDLLRTAIDFAHRQIVEAARTSDAYAGMGTTVVAALIDDDRVTVAHVGDSRLYLRSPDGLRCLTEDDSWMNALTNVVGSPAGAVVHVADARLERGTRLLLSTDGVHGVLSDRRLQRLLDDDDVKQSAEGVVRTAIRWGSPDNCTAIVARYEPD